MYLSLHNVYFQLFGLDMYKDLGDIEPYLLVAGDIQFLKYVAASKVKHM